MSGGQTGFTLALAVIGATLLSYGIDMLFAGKARRQLHDKRNLVRR